MKQVNVAPEDGTPILFCIKPKKIGQIPLKVTALTGNAGDGVEVFLNVEAEGIKKFMNKAVLVDLRKTTPFLTQLTCDIPANLVIGSEEVQVSAIGDILGPTLLNLDDLIR
jgi:CD109 antigen